MKRFGKYLLVRKIASGGMADVFKAKALGIRGFTKTLAIKRIHPHLAEDVRFIHMFTDEAKIAAALVHPNIVQIYDLGEEQNVPYIAMEYVPGRDLLEVLRRCHQVRRRFPVALACRVVAEVCQGLEHAHEFKGLDGQLQEIVHRDVTPRNVLLGYGGAVKLTDFGVARAKHREEQTEAGLIKGKVRYLSPEAAAGMEVDRRSDLYSLGAMFIELLTMRPLYDSGTEIEVLLAIAEGKYDRARLDELPPHLAPVIERSLVADREQRHATADEMREDLLRVAGDQIAQVRADEVASAMQFLFSKEIDAEREDDRRTEALIAEQARKHSRPGVPRPSPVNRPGPPPMPESAIEELDEQVEIIPLTTELDESDTSDLEIEVLEATPDDGSNVDIDLDATDWDEVDVSDSQAKNPFGASPSEVRALLDSVDTGPQAPEPQAATAEPPTEPEPPAAPKTVSGRDWSLVPDIRIPIPKTDVPKPQPEPGAVRPVPPVSEVSPHSTAPWPVADGEEPDFQGDLSQISLVRVLSQLTDEQASGRLDLRRDPVQKAIFFSDGDPLFATSNVEAELFGEHLVSQGIISREALENALSEAAVKHTRLTQALLAIGLLAPHDLYRHLAEQVRAKILDLFTWVSGRYAFFSGSKPPEGGFPLGLTAYGLIRDGVREHISPVMIRRALHPYREQVVETTGGALPPSLRLTGKEQRVVHLISSRDYTLGKLCEQIGDEELVLQVVYMLKEIQHLGFK